MLAIFVRAAALLSISLAPWLTAPCLAQQSILVGSQREQAADAAIRAALRHASDMHYLGRPLAAAIQDIAEDRRVNLVLDRVAIADAGIDIDELKVTARLENVRVDAALNHFLQPYGLTWLVRDEALVVTSKEAAQNALQIRIYPARDLTVVNDKEQGKVVDVPDFLIDVIVRTVAVDSWDELGGPGTVEYLEQAGSLAIRQTREVHDQVEALLAGLRSARDLQGIKPLADPPPSAQIHQAAPVPRSYVPPPSWNQPRVYPD